MQSHFRNAGHTYTRIEDAGPSTANFRPRLVTGGGPRVSPQRDQTLTPVPEDQSEEEGSVGGFNHKEKAGGVLDQYYRRSHLVGAGSSRPNSFEPLPGIDSGEPLTWSDYNYTGTTQSSEDPFVDTYADTYDEEEDEVDEYLSNDHSKPGIRDLSRPSSSVYETPSTIPSNITGYTQYTEASQYDHHTPPRSLDHFRYDTEAYTSGSNPRRRSALAQSRSPTPAVDDEDYYVGGDGSVRYSGDSPSPLSTRRSRISDPEKGIASRDIGVEGTSEAMRYAALEWKAMMSEKMSTISSGDRISAPPGYPEPESPETTRHFGPAPTGRIHRRNKLKKRVQLTNGNLVVDLSVPPKMVLPRVGEPEMMKTRYTAVTCDPDDFERRGFFLRQNEYGRSTEIFIVVTMYNVSF